MGGKSLINTSLVEAFDHYLNRLFPLARSITGRGNRETLNILKEIIPINIKEYPSGSEVYDWIIPAEWIIHDAYIKDSKGKRLVDYKKNNLHIVNYSTAINQKMPFSELEKHLYLHGELSDSIPYRTSYYNLDWGFCITKKQHLELKKEEVLEVFIDSSMDTSGSLSVGELLIEGQTSKEILISTYICHPSLANDNLSGLLMTAFLAKKLLEKKQKSYFSYRIIWVPETIGAIAYCAMNEEFMKKIDLGLLVTTVGGEGQYGYKQSFNASSQLNEIIEDTFKSKKIDYITYPFDIHGSDERQYSSQGFRINVASITKDKYYEYPYYHTSSDDLSFIKSEHLVSSLELYLEVLQRLDSIKSTNSEAIKVTKKEPNSKYYLNSNPFCEVMLSKYDLYPKTGGGQVPTNKTRNQLDLTLWLLFWCDGNHTLNEIAKKIEVPSKDLYAVAKNLLEKGLLIENKKI